ncbi:unnamed protein product, partial [Choristocarpus tenellus]
MLKIHHCTSRQAKPEYDTLGSTAAEFARRHAAQEAARSAIPGPAPSELVVPVGDPMGKKLLRTMGWREGQGVGRRVRRRKGRRGMQKGIGEEGDEIPDAAREGLSHNTRALFTEGELTFAPENTESFVKNITAKNDLYGVGHDPYVNAPEFGHARRARESHMGGRAIYRTGDLVSKNGCQGTQGESGRLPVEVRGSHGFVLDDGEDDVYERSEGKEGYDNSLDIEDSQVAARRSLAETAHAWALDTMGETMDSQAISRKYARCPSDGRLPVPGFIVAETADFEQKHWRPPTPPMNFDPVHTFKDGEGPISQDQAKGRPHFDALNARVRASVRGEPQWKQSMPVPSSSLAEEPRSTTSSSVSTRSVQSSFQAAKLIRGASPQQLQANIAMSAVMGTGISATHSFASSGIERQEQGVGGLQMALASKFTSGIQGSGETQRGTPSTTDDLSMRPAGLSLPKVPGSTANVSSSASGDKCSVATEQGMKVVDITPVRITRPWSPVPLLCKRLNVPVPAVSKEVNWTSLGDNGANTATVSTVGEVAFQNFVREGVPCPPLSQPAPALQASLLQGLEISRSLAIDKAATGAYIPVDMTGETPVEKPKIDLFKSIFESESESDSISEDEEEGGGGEGDGGKAGHGGRASVEIEVPSTNPVQMAGVKGSAQWPGEKSLPFQKPPKPNNWYGSDSSESESGGE